jgi:serralysin
MTIAINLSNNPDIDGILWGWAWGNGGSLNLSFSFPTETAEYTDNGYVAINGFTAFNATQQTAARAVLANVASFSGLTFSETTNAFAVLRFAEASSVNYTNDSDVSTQTGLQTIGTAQANPPELEFGGVAPASAPYAQGDSWYNPTGYNNPVLGSFQYAAGIMHETGHNLGLKHGHVTQDGHGITFPMLPADHNSYEYSVMTYSQFPGDTGSGDNAPDHPTTFMQDDIAALQYLYGANYGATAQNGNTVYTWSPTTGEAFINGTGQGAPQTNFVLMTIWDGGGVDSYNLSNYTTNLSVDLNPGAWIVLDTSPAQAQRANLGTDGSAGATPYFARGNIANALIDPNNLAETASLIENAIGGTGNDAFLGNAIANELLGGGGNDTIDGAGGVDTAIYGGARSGYKTTGLGGQSVRIADLRSGTPDGTDTTSNVEFFRFSNRTYTLAEVLNQPPVLFPDAGSPHALIEIAGTTNSGVADAVAGTLSFTDESGDAHTASDSLSSATWSGGAAVPGVTQTALASAMSASISVDAAAGTLAWQFSVADRNVDFLAASETLTAVYDVSIADQLGNSASVPVTIFFTGTNDVPVVDAGTSVLTDSINELPGVTGSLAIDSALGVIAFSDPDLNDRPTATIGTQTVSWQDAANDYTSELSAAQIADLVSALGITAQAGNTNGGLIEWTYDIVDGLLDFLAVGESLTVTSQIVIDDQKGATVNPSVVVTLNGANDAPIALPDSNGTPKDSTLIVSAVNGLFSNDIDPDVHDQDGLFVSEVNGSAVSVGNAVVGIYGSVTLNADGSYVYVANRGSLPSKIVAQDTFFYTVADGNGGTDTATLSIVVFNPGVNYLAGIDTTLTGGTTSNVLDGSAGGDILLGGNSADVLIGGDGDTLTGNNGPDVFLFRPDFGANTITDFDVKTDAMQFDKSIFADFADLLGHTADTAGGAVITDDDGNAITLVGVDLSDLEGYASGFYSV